MAQAVSRPPLTSEARIRAQVSPFGFYGGQIGTGTAFSTSSSFLGFHCRYYSTVAFHAHMSSEG
jgi:hypothetical protein